MVKISLDNGGERLVPTRAIVQLQPVTCMTRPKKSLPVVSYGFCFVCHEPRRSFQSHFKSKKVLYG